jgi:hypothetical protein
MAQFILRGSLRSHLVRMTGILFDGVAYDVSGSIDP